MAHSRCKRKRTGSGLIFFFIKIGVAPLSKTTPHRIPHTPKVFHIPINYKQQQQQQNH